MASLALGAAACDALLGLGQYQSVACVGSDCPPDAAADTRADVDIDQDAGSMSDDAPPDTSPMPPPDAPYDGPSLHELWAHWPMPNPDASVGGDSSAPLPNPMSYEAGAPGTSTVRDAVTHLVWETTGSAAPMSFDDAATHCAGIGMRLPTRIELVSIIDFTQQPTIDSATFPGTSPSRYWTESVVAHDAGAPDAAIPYWTIDFSDGLVHDDPTTQAYVRCVSGGDSQ